MTTKAKNSVDRLLLINEIVARHIIELSDTDMDIAIKKNPSLSTSGTIAKSAYLRALSYSTPPSQAANTKRRPQKLTLNDYLQQGRAASIAKASIMNLAAANDPSLQLVADNVAELADADILELYKSLVETGILKD